MFRSFILSLILLVICPCFALSYTEQQISNLEFNRYGQSFVDDSLADRLNRLEMDVLGMSQSGDIDSRIGRLNDIFMHEMPTPQIDYYKPERKSAIKNILNNVSSLFDNGYMTGFIPSLENSYGSHYYRNNSPQYCPYHNSYHSSYHHRPARFSHYNPHVGYNPYGPAYQRPTYGYTNTTTGSSVHILRD